MHTSVLWRGFYVSVVTFGLGVLLVSSAAAQDPAPLPASENDATTAAPASVYIATFDGEEAAAEEGEVACDCATLEALNKAAGKAYKGVYYDNNFDYLCDPCYDDWHLGERMKRVGMAPQTVVDFGGEYRIRFHDENNLRGLPLSGNDDEFTLHRTRLYLNVEHGGWFRAYLEGIDAASFDEDFLPRGIETNRFDALNMFGEARVWQNDCGQMWFRAGRQELLYGAQRFISPLDWSNTRRTFDGFKVYWEGANWDVDAFWTRPIRHGQHLGPMRHRFDSPSHEEEFAGIYATCKGVPGKTFDFYYLRLANYAGATRGEVGMGDMDVNMLGLRMKGDWCNLMWEVEGAAQFGDYGADNTRAGGFTVGLGRKFECVAMTPTVWAYYDWASGDANPTDGVHGTFNQYFPLGHKYFGFMDIIGRQNIEDFNVLATLQPHDKVKFLMWYHLFRLEEARDGVYNAGGGLIYRDPTGASGDEVGNELDLALNWTITPRMNMLFGYSYFWAGNYFNTVPGANGQDAEFFYTQFAVRF